MEARYRRCSASEQEKCRKGGYCAYLSLNLSIIIVFNNVGHAVDSVPTERIHAKAFLTCHRKERSHLEAVALPVDYVQRQPAWRAAYITLKRPAFYLLKHYVS